MNLNLWEVRTERESGKICLNFTWYTFLSNYTSNVSDMTWNLLATITTHYTVFRETRASKASRILESIWSFSGWGNLQGDHCSFYAFVRTGPPFILLAEYTGLPAILVPLSNGATEFFTYWTTKPLITFKILAVKLLLNLRGHNKIFWVAWIRGNRGFC